jgi:hypothetical protein
MKTLVPLDQCQAWALANPLMAEWNLSFRRDRLVRRADIRRTMRQNLRCEPKGGGNKAWKRAGRQERQWRAFGGFYLSDLVKGVL